MASKHIIIASVDIKCETSNGQYSNAEHDKIIQITTTFKKYKEDECYLKHLIVLGNCDPIDNVIIECYDNEKNVLFAWTCLMRKNNPDIIIGYNIFGFDFNYMHTRSQKLDCRKDFVKLQRNGSESMFIKCGKPGEESSYFQMKDRIQIDILKFIQRKHKKLNSYEFDNVVEYFLKDKIENSLDGLNICILCHVLFDKLKIPIDGKNLSSECIKG